MRVAILSVIFFCLYGNNQTLAAQDSVKSITLYRVNIPDTLLPHLDLMGVEKKPIKSTALFLNILSVKDQVVFEKFGPIPVVNQEFHYEKTRPIYYFRPQENGAYALILDDKKAGLEVHGTATVEQGHCLLSFTCTHVSIGKRVAFLHPGDQAAKSFIEESQVGMPENVSSKFQSSVRAKFGDPNLVGSIIGGSVGAEGVVAPGNLVYFIIAE